MTTTESCKAGSCNDIAAFSAISKINYQGILEIDLVTKKLLFISENISDFHLATDQSLQDNEFQKSIASEDYPLSLEANKAFFRIFYHQSPEDRPGCSCFYDVHILLGKITLLATIGISPVSLTETGKIQKLVCTIAPSSHKAPGNIYFCLSDHSVCWNYSMQTHRWNKTAFILLTPREKQVLYLSARGFSSIDIAHRLFVSIESVKKFKHNIYTKTNSHSISEAILFATNYLLI